MTARPAITSSFRAVAVYGAKETIKAFNANKTSWVGLAIFMAVVLMAILAPWLAPHDPLAFDTAKVLSPPSWSHMLGTDGIGRDVLSRMIYGARISLLVGFVSVGIAAVIGTALGSCAGYFGGWIDALIMRFVDIMLCFPTFFLILAVIAFLEPSIWNIMIIIGLTSWMYLARIVRANFLSLKERDFIMAAHTIGTSNLSIIFKHILPNSIAPIIVSGTLSVASAIINEAYISFLGLGVQPPTATWGNMLEGAYNYIEAAPWLWIFPGSLIVLTVLSINFVGDGLRDALDPHALVNVE
ncbi:MAG TPA: peptide ABC transporter permease [Chloroflexi bacterium]|nr:peptide ABC transporter permease [Chloroflexota bacterium]